MVSTFYALSFFAKKIITENMIKVDHELGLNLELNNSKILIDK